MKREEKKQTIDKEANASMSHSSNSMHQKRQWTAESATQKPVAAEAKKDTTPKKPTPKYEDDLAFEEKKIAPNAYTYNNQASTYNAQQAKPVSKSSTPTFS